MDTAALNADLIGQIAAQQLGAPPAQAAAPQGAAPMQEPTPPKSNPNPTQMEQAQAKLAPKDEADMSAEEAIRMIKLGDREYTESQLNGTMQRYRDLNFRWQNEVAPYQPVLQVVQNLMKEAEAAGAKPDGKQAAALIEAAVKAYVKNPQMGGDGEQAKGASKQGMKAEQAGADLGDNDDETYSAWERENAVKLPPGFKDMAKSNKQMAQQMNALVEMLQTLVNGGSQQAQVLAGAEQQMAQAQNMQSEAAVNMIRNNLNGGFQQAGIPLDEATRADFQMFAAQRGYDFPDFMDPQLTMTVIADYKANKDAPEIQRLRQIAQKRQAFTGMADGTPGAGGAPVASGDPMLAGLIQTAMAGR